jgi:hypothetical protein
VFTFDDLITTLDVKEKAREKDTLMEGSVGTLEHTLCAKGAIPKVIPSLKTKGRSL